MDKDKIKRYERKFDELLAEMAEETFSKVELKKLENKLREILSKKDITFQLSTLKAFNEGVMFTVAAQQHDKDLPNTMLMAVKLMIKHKEKDLKEAVTNTLTSSYEPIEPKKETVKNSKKEDGNTK